jgi:hypothetical protein
MAVANFCEARNSRRMGTQIYTASTADNHLHTGVSRSTFDTEQDPVPHGGDEAEECSLGEE